MLEHEPASWMHEQTAGGSVVVELRGEIDALVAPRLSTYLDDLTARERPDVVLDMRLVTFIDCSGISSLVRVNRRTTERRGRLRLVCTDPRALRTLRITRLIAHFHILADLPDPSPSVGGA